MARIDPAFRLLVKRERQRQPDLFAEDPYFHHAVASHGPIEEKRALQVWAWHNPRGQAENFLQERKGGFGLDRRPCGQSFAPAVFFRPACPEAFGHHSRATFCWKLIQVAGRIVHHAGQLIWKLALDAEKLLLFRQIRKRCLQLALT